MKNKKPGIIYGMTNPNKNWIKIGRVEDTTVGRLRARWKSMCQLGEMLVVRRAVRVKDVHKMEEWMHKLFEPQRHKGEMFNIKPAQFCAAICLISGGRGDRDISEFIKEAKREAQNHYRPNPYEEKMWDEMKLECPPLAQAAPASAPASVPPPPVRSSSRAAPRRVLSFADMGIKEGDEITHAKTGVTAKIADPEKRTVIFEGKIVSINTATQMMHERLGIRWKGSSNYQWKFKGRTLISIVKQKYREMGL